MFFIWPQLLFIYNLLSILLETKGIVVKRNITVLFTFCFLLTIAVSVTAQSDPEVDRLSAQGVKAYEADNYVEAEKIFLQAIALEEQKQIPTIRRKSTSYVYLSDIYARVKKNRAKGDETIQKFLSFDKSWAQVYRTYAITISSADKTDQTAIDYLTEAVLLEPKNPENYYQRALALHQFPGRAIADLTLAIKADPKFALAYQERAMNYLKRGEYAEAATDYEKYYRLDPTGGEVYFLRHGMALLFNGDVISAIADFTKLIGDPANKHAGRRASAFYYRGYGNLLNRNRAAAQGDMIEAVKLDPAMKSYWYTRLAMEPDEKCRSEKKTTDEIEDLYKDKRYTSANNNEFRYQLFKLRANLAICEPNSPKAVFKLLYQNSTDDVNIDHSHLQKYLRTLAPTEAQRDPNLPEVVKTINDRFGFNLDSGSKSIALRDLTAGIGTTANHLERIAVAQKAIIDKNYHLAIALLNYVLDIEPGNVSAQEERMRAFLFKGAYARAFEESQKLLKANPKNAIALNVRGLVNEMAVRDSAALADYNAAIAADPKYDKAYFNRGRFYLDQKKPDMAIKDFDSAMSQANENWTYLVYRGHAHYALKDYKSATRDYALVILSDKYNYDARGADQITRQRWNCGQPENG